MNHIFSQPLSVIAVATAILISGCDAEQAVSVTSAPLTHQQMTITRTDSATPTPAQTLADAGENTADASDSPVSTQDSSTIATLPWCRLSESDSDGDGYGFENGRSCIVPQSNIDNRTDELDPPAPAFIQPPIAEYIDETPINLDRVTDVILTAGQSNAFANETRFEPFAHAEDRLDSRILVWTQFDGWKTANPMTQIWEHDDFPAQPWDATLASNSPGFQIARAIVDADPNRVVAFIPTSAPGKPIYHWRLGGQPYNDIKQRVESAINELPHKAHVDLIWWMQGEADGNDSEYYRNSLADLINNWRSEPWYGPDKHFIANETASFEVNQVFRDLRYNADPYSDYSMAEGLATSDGVHFLSDSIRLIGNRVQQVYFDMLQNTSQ